MSCSEKCWTPVDCPEHGDEMWPVGRSAPLGTFECCELSGQSSTNTRHLFSEHDSDRYYFDREGWVSHEALCARCNHSEDEDEPMTPDPLDQEQQRAFRELDQTRRTTDHTEDAE